MKNPFLQISILFLGYLAYLLLEGPLNLLLEEYSLPILYQGFLSNFILLFPLLVIFVYLLFRLKLEKSLALTDRRIFLIPSVYLLFIVVNNFGAFKTAISLDFIPFLFALCMVGFTEEFLFRGIIFPKMSKAFSSVYAGAIATSFLFGIGHYLDLVRNPEYFNAMTSQVVYAFCVGILMCGLFYRTKNLIVPALIHTFLNLQAMIRTFNGIRSDQIPEVGNKEVFQPSIGEALSQEWMIHIFYLVLGFGLIAHQRRKEKRDMLQATPIISDPQ